MERDLSTLPNPIFLGLLLLTLLLPPRGLEAQSFPTDQEVVRILQDRLDIGRNPGFVIGMLEDGRTRVVTAGTSGRDGLALDGNTVMEIGSATKVLTAVLLQEMASRGEVGLAEPVQDLLPEGVEVPRSEDGREITLVDLAIHRSGLPRMPSNFSPSDPSNPYLDYTVEQMYAFLSGYELPREIGEEWEYSNLAVGLLGHALALRAGRDYEELLRERLLDPLGMDDTAMELPARLEARLAPGHSSRGVRVSNWDIPTLGGAGGVRSTAHDMLRFLEANLPSARGGLTPVLEKTHVVRGRTSEELGDMSMALGWVVSHRFSDRPIHWHNGGTGGYRFFMGVDKTGERAVVLLTNSNQGADDIGFHLLDPRHELAPPEPFVERTAVEVDPAVLRRYVGAYELSPGLVLDVTLVDGQLVLQAPGQGRLALQPESETGFFVSGVEVRVTFVLDEGGEVTGLVVHQGGQETSASRVGAGTSGATLPVSWPRPPASPTPPGAPRRWRRGARPA